MSKPTTTMATNSPAIAGTKYRSAIDGPCVGAAVGVGAAGSIAKLETACEG